MPLSGKANTFVAGATKDLRAAKRANARPSPDEQSLQCHTWSGCLSKTKVKVTLALRNELRTVLRRTPQDLG
jgi:hypothetical protein